MRVDHSSYPGVRWLVWHVPACREIKHVMWVDDEAMLVAVAPRPLAWGPDGQLRVTVRQHQRVLVRPQAALILVDPLDDDEPAQEAVLRVAVELVGADDGSTHARTVPTRTGSINGTGAAALPPLHEEHSPWT